MTGEASAFFCMRRAAISNIRPCNGSKKCVSFTIDAIDTIVDVIVDQQSAQQRLFRLDIVRQAG